MFLLIMRIDQRLYIFWSIANLPKSSHYFSALRAINVTPPESQLVKSHLKRIVQIESTACDHRNRIQWCWSASRRARAVPGY